ncbi:hypothetical protein PULV_a3689 [Pseudoalteromonas ulvae UL12]|nr:hypothetical protein [Pseudoalteromonas ulvae UL12]
MAKSPVTNKCLSGLFRNSFGTSKMAHKLRHFFMQKQK